METTVIEINGIKMGADMRTAKISTVDTFKVGDPVKLLYKSYSSYDVKYGVIIGFDQFKGRPTITVAYLNSNELAYCYIHEGVEHQIVAVQEHDLAMEKTWILDRMADSIKRAEQELDEKRRKMDHFVKFFGKYFEAGIPTAANN